MVQKRTPDHRIARILGVVGADLLVSFGEMALCAYGLNILFWYMVNILYYGSNWAYSFSLWNTFVNDIFGTCAQGFNSECTAWL